MKCGCRNHDEEPPAEPVQQVGNRSAITEPEEEYLPPEPADQKSDSDPPENIKLPTSGSTLSSLSRLGDSVGARRPEAIRRKNNFIEDELPKICLNSRPFLAGHTPSVGRQKIDQRAPSLH